MDINAPISPKPVADRFQRPLRDLRLSVTDRCNFRCPYCMPLAQFHDKYPFFTRDELLSSDEAVRLTRLFAALGACKVRLTGGEPLLRKDLPELVARLVAIDGVEDVAMSTNGMLLPRFAPALKAAGLARVTVSLDTLDEKAFATLSGDRGSLQGVLDGVAAARDAGFDDLKINTVLKRGVNDAQVLDLVEHFRFSGSTLRFIEYMDVGTRNDWRLEDVITSAELHALIDAQWPLEARAPNYRGEVANRFRFRDGGGEIGFISSVSQPFCRDCTRARLSAEGRFYTCLFAAEGIDLRQPLRDGADDAALSELIAGRWRVRDDRYSELRGKTAGDATKKVEMYQVGG